MITASELLEIKSRLLTAAEAARQIASSADPVRYDEEMYQAVSVALLSLQNDIARVLAELDVLRGMFAQSVSLFMEGHRNEVPDGRGDVAAVQGGATVSGGEGERKDIEGAGVGVPASGPARKRAKRSQPRRNRKGDSEPSVAVGRSDGGESLDSSKDG
jgi:hypothetical protein